jgi:hypothetical protein
MSVPAILPILYDHCMTAPLAQPTRKLRGKR